MRDRDDDWHRRLAAGIIRQAIQDLTAETPGDRRRARGWLLESTTAAHWADVAGLSIDALRRTVRAEMPHWLPDRRAQPRMVRDEPRHVAGSHAEHAGRELVALEQPAPDEPLNHRRRQIERQADLFWGE